MKVIKTVTWKESEAYLDSWDMSLEVDDRNRLSDEFEKIVMQYCKENDIRLSGDQYQHAGENVPIIEHEGKEYSFHASMRHWGGLMYDIWGDGSGSDERSEGMGYCNWAWTNPDEDPHEKCKKCLHYYFHNMDFSKGLLHIHDHADNPELNCRGISVGPPKHRTVWECDRWLENSGYDSGIVNKC
jgi:hypothetical protein